MIVKAIRTIMEIVLSVGKSGPGRASLCSLFATNLVEKNAKTTSKMAQLVVFPLVGLLYPSGDSGRIEMNDVKSGGMSCPDAITFFHSCRSAGNRIGRLVVK
ncbi:hypothetical protein [Parageobacillus thermoglucosidasius]|uniref:hypothetical protein n=1 Tax=Parageobacillus thermoglucosidasius TaxID=1426 RepID=UPI0002DA2211|nr:hypothetical protein [Parageobacillus thermoglucosidasius]MBY6268465.1 hypothetical protein [Parageobacillus thermoglucosidasius]MED4903232.1 hypothetical protein [Parageobacillus thermoglucosidasius]MED4914691.1 hypothetical protein [Parageobacillus thermoglucosidasius]MED4946316.1 hypothetical protein [Parageobacillus thermoglucosidasius]MED4982502.1 hypothetical protein [Parageobacillus thermoglucosidasius]